MKWDFTVCDTFKDRTMSIPMSQYLREATKRDEEQRLLIERKEQAEDAYFDALGELIDQHPIGRVVATRRTVK